MHPQEHLELLSKQYVDTIEKLNKINKEFNPIKDNLEIYKIKYEEKEKELFKLTEDYSKIKTKLSHISTRNVNKRIKAREN